MVFLNMAYRLLDQRSIVRSPIRVDPQKETLYFMSIIVAPAIITKTTTKI